MCIVRTPNADAVKMRKKMKVQKEEISLVVLDFG